MANLSDIVAAIDRLSEKIGEPRQAAEAMTPTHSQPVRALPYAPQTTTAEAIGLSVARHVNALPSLRAIGTQLSIIAQTMKRTGPQTIPQQVLPVAERLPPATQALQRITGPVRNAGELDIVRLLSGGLGGVPIMGTAMRQFGLLHTLLGDRGQNLSELQQRESTAKTRAGHYRAWRDLMEPSQAANAIMGTVEKFGPTAIGNRLSKSWNVLKSYAVERESIMTKADPREVAPALGVLNKAAMGAAIDFAIVGGSVAAVGASVVAFGKAISNANKQLAAYSPGMSMAYALADIATVFRDMASAQRRAPAQARFSVAYTEFQNAIRPGIDAFLNAIQDVATKLLKVGSAVANFFNEHPKLTTALGIGGAAALGYKVGGLPGAAVGGGVAASMSGGWLGYGGAILAGAGLGFKMGGPWGAAAGGLGAAALADKPWGAQEKGEITSSLAEAKKALADMVDALKRNTEELRKNGSGGLLVADFMSMIARGNFGFQAPAMAFHPQPAGLRAKNRRAAFAPIKAALAPPQATLVPPPLGVAAASDEGYADRIKLTEFD